MKPRPSKLDEHAERLDDWFLPKSEGGQGKTYEEVQEQLRLDGLSVSVSRLCKWWAARQAQKQQEALLSQIASGGRMNRELDKAYAENPAPGIDQLISVTKTLVMSLQVQGTAEPKLLNLANSMQQTVLTYLSAKTNAELKEKDLAIKERRIALLEKKAAAYDRAQAALTEAKNSKGGITPETLTRIEQELRLL